MDIYDKHNKYKFMGCDFRLELQSVYDVNRGRSIFLYVDNNIVHHYPTRNEFQTCAGKETEK